MKKTIITAQRQKALPNIKHLIKYRALIWSFSKRDLKIQYAQTMLGILWSILRPLTGLLIYTLFFGYLLKVGAGSIPYPLFAFSGMICWYLFSYVLAGSGTAIIESQYIIKKVYFPKIILPLSKVMVGIVEFSISLIVLLLLMFIWGVIPGFKIILLPFIILLIVAAGLSIGIWLSALTIRFRDFHHIIPYLVNFGIFLTPVFYPAILIPSGYEFLIYLNPMAGVIEGMRWMLFGGAIPSVYYAVGVLPVLLLLFTGLYYFTKMESEMVDII